MGFKVKGLTGGEWLDDNKHAKAEQDKAQADQQQQATSDTQKLMDQRPQFQSEQDANGNLKAPYSSAGPADNTSALQKKLDGRTKVASKDITQQTAASTGQSYKDAQGQLQKNMAFANSSDPSDQAKAQSKLADQNQAQQQQQLTHQGMNANQANQNAMAQQGGMGGGARERMNTQAQRQAVMGGQGLAAQNMQSKTQIGANDAANKLSMQQSVVGQAQGLDQYQSGLQLQNNSQELGRQQANQSAGLQAQTANLQGDLSAANQWGSMATSQNQMGVANNQFNATTASRNNMLGNQDALNSWGMQGQMQGANAAANAAAPQRTYGVLSDLGLNY